MKRDFVNDDGHLRDVAADAVRLARKGGADMAEAAAAESIGMEVSVRRGALDGMDIGREQSLSLTAYVGGGTGAATVGELTAAAMRDAVARALAIAKLSAADPHAGLADAGLMAAATPDLALYHPWAVTPEDAIALARRGEEAAFAANAEISRDKSDGASVSTQATLEAYANSHGFAAAERSTAHSISVSAIAQRGDDMQSDGWSETRRNAGDLPPPEKVGCIAAERAARRLGGGKVADGRAGVLFQAPAAHTLIRHFVGAAAGGALFRKMSWLLGRLDTAVFPPHFHIRELPHLRGEMASAAYDDDGVATRARDVVADGIWRGGFLSAYSARRLGMQTTANAGGAHNLEVSAGEVTAAGDLAGALGRGLWVTDLMGQGVNAVSGDYSRGAAGFWVEGGEVQYPVAEVTIAGNLRDMLLSIAAAGDDAVRRGLIKCGSLLIPDMAIGGNR